MKRAEYNQVANYVYTQQEVKIAIGNPSPTVYIERVRDQCNGDQRVYGGIIDLDDMALNFDENATQVSFLYGSLFEYEDFLSACRNLIAKKLNDYYFSL